MSASLASIITSSIPSPADRSDITRADLKAKFITRSYPGLAAWTWQQKSKIAPTLVRRNEQRA
jgi:hypothetical protein